MMEVPRKTDTCSTLKSTPKDVNVFTHSSSLSISFLSFSIVNTTYLKVGLDWLLNRKSLNQSSKNQEKSVKILELDTIFVL